MTNNLVNWWINIVIEVTISIPRPHLNLHRQILFSFLILDFSIFLPFFIGNHLFCLFLQKCQYLVEVAHEIET